MPRAAADIADLVGRVTAADGETPLNEQALLNVGRSRSELVHLTAESNGGLVGYAQGDRSASTGQLLVDPYFRRAGHGSALLAGLAANGISEVWAFGDTEAAQGFARDRGLSEHRRLLVLERALPAGPATPTPAGFTIARFTDADADGLLGVNAAAFDWHPEQRHFSRSDLDDRVAADWFDPSGLLVARDQFGVAGFHWTKVHPDGRGEVYILAVHPRTQGTGLGKSLLGLGLDHLARGGCPTVFLYVEAANTRAVDLYQRVGFRDVHRDVLYGPTPTVEGATP